MDTCIIDQLGGDHEQPTPEMIERAKNRQLEALKDLRRRLIRRSELLVVHAPAA